ncbi:hypothetical protein ABN220_17860, partial [Proteus cibi]
VNRQNAGMVAIALGLGGSVSFIAGHTVIAATPELIAIAQVAFNTCKTNWVYCANQLGINIAGISAPEAAIAGVTFGSGYKVLASSEESTKAFSSMLANSAKSLITSGKLNITAIKPIVEQEKLLIEANKRVIEEINKISSKSKAKDIATMVAAYDIKTGTIIVRGSVGSDIKIEMLHKDTVILLKNKLGDAKVGTKTVHCDNIVGGCGEVLAADQLIRKGIKPQDIRISQAYRPRKAYGYDLSTMPEEAFVDTCKNCIKVFLDE